MKSQGLPVSKDSLHAFLAYFEDAFLIRTTSLLSASERQRMVNPRKAYPIDPGLIPIYERTGRAHSGHALETAVFIDLLPPCALDSAAASPRLIFLPAQAAA